MSGLKKFLSRNARNLILAGIILAALSISSIGKLVEMNANQPTPKADIAREAIDPTVIYNLVNDERQNAGVQRLSLNPLAQQAAQQKCDDMVAGDYYDHLNPTTGEHGYKYAINLVKNGVFFNENLNQGDVLTNAQFVKGWINSPGHKATMLDPKFTDTGVAVCKIPSESENSRTVVQEFIQVDNTSKPVVNNYTTNRVPVTVPKVYTPPMQVHCSTTYADMLDTAYTTCY
jgi:uncharacterized protein YkwD